MNPPFRADHVGSLLRPKELHEARAQERAGRMSKEKLKEVQDRGGHRRRVPPRLVAHRLPARL